MNPKIRTVVAICLIVVSINLFRAVHWTGQLASSLVAYMPDDSPLPHRDSEHTISSEGPLELQQNRSILLNHSDVNVTEIHQPINSHGIELTQTRRIAPVFGACLMVRNDNNILPEWIAYHYTKLPLRYLVVYSDKKSREDPSDVLERWNNTDLQYWVWHKHAQIDRQVRLQSKQAFFYRKCVHFLNETWARSSEDREQRWVLILDSDEYFRWNPTHKQDLKEMTRVLASNGTWIPNDAKQLFQQNRSHDSILERVQARLALNESGHTNYTIVDVLEASNITLAKCHAFPRLRFSAVERNYKNRSVCGPIPQYDFLKNSSRLLTLRYVYHGKLEDWKGNRYVKTMVDLSRMTKEDVDDFVSSPHNPFQACPRPPTAPNAFSMFRANHYLQSLDTFMSRNDELRTPKSWSRHSNLRHGFSCDNHLWVDDFRREQGLDRAKILLPF